MPLYRISAALPNGDVVFVAYDEDGLIPVCEQIARVAEVCPPAEWEAVPLGENDDPREALR